MATSVPVLRKEELAWHALPLFRRSSLSGLNEDKDTNIISSCLTQPHLDNSYRDQTPPTNSDINEIECMDLQPPSPSSPSSPAGSAGFRCPHPSCTSTTRFARRCDLRKHTRRHYKHLFCRISGCPESENAVMASARASNKRISKEEMSRLGRFSSAKDRARHEAKHNPQIKCQWQGDDGQPCNRVFSRADNMKDHVNRVHLKIKKVRL